MTMAMELIRHIAGLYGGKAIKGDFTQVYITGNEIWMAQQVLAEQAEGAQGNLDEYAEFESWLEREKPAGCIGDIERGWMARAALAQPSQAPEAVYAVFADNGNIRCWAMDRNHGSLKELEIEGCTVVPLQSVAVAQAGQVPYATAQDKALGWTLDYRFVERVTDLAGRRTEYSVSMEATEQVLLAARELLAAAPAQGGE